jgi:hypothetical protein
LAAQPAGVQQTVHVGTSGTGCYFILFYLFSFLFMLWVEDILLRFMYRHV